MKYFFLLFITSLFSCGEKTPQKQELTYNSIAWQLNAVVDEYSNPMTQIYLEVDEQVFQIDSAYAIDLLPKERWIDYKIPEDALIACGGWWAGQGNYYYVIPTGSALEVLRGYQGEEMEPSEELKYEVIKSIGTDDLKRIVLTESGNNNTNKVSVGETIIIKLNSNPTTGFRWSLADKGENDFLTLLYSGYRAKEKSEGMVGVGGYEVWQFTASKAGEAEVELEYKRAWEKDIPAQSILKYKFTIK